MISECCIRFSIGGCIYAYTMFTYIFIQVVLVSVMLYHINRKMHIAQYVMLHYMALPIALQYCVAWCVFHFSYLILSYPILS